MFGDRIDAGRQLARLLLGSDLLRPVAIGLPRGGVPVAREVADALRCPLDVLVVRKVGAPGQPELGIAAAAEGGTVVVNAAVRSTVELSASAFHALVSVEREEVERRVALYRRAQPAIDVSGRDVIVVDDGLATGVSAEAAVNALRARGPHRVLLAIPVGAAETARRLRGVADDVVCVTEPHRLGAVGTWYRDFAPVRIDEVVAILAANEP